MPVAGRCLSRRPGGRLLVLPRGLLVPLAVAAVGACGAGEDETCEVPTEQMSAVAVVIDSGYDIRATIDFEAGDRRGRSAPLALCDSDVLTINGRSPSEITKANRIEYALGFEADAARRFRFELVREDQGERVTLDLTLPPPFEVINPVDGQQLPRDEELRLEWQPPDPGRVIQIELGEELGQGACLLTEDPAHEYKRQGGVQVPDRGDWTIPAGAITEGPGQAGGAGTGGTDGTCPVTYLLSRVSLGEYPTTLQQGGRLEGRVERYVDVDSVASVD